MPGPKTFVEHVEHRSVWQVLGVYVVGSWVAIQVVDVLANFFALPDWFPRSIAVLPLASHDDLLTQLSKIDSLTTISRTSVMKYQDTQMGVRESAAELGVATLLEGSVQLPGERVRVSVQLVDALNDRQLWAETYDAELTTASIFASMSAPVALAAGGVRTSGWSLTWQQDRR